jgi:ribosomal protein L23
MKKIKHLIHIPEIETVIKINELYDYDQKHLTDKIYNTFILTKEVLFGVSLMIKKMAQKQNAGFIVKGSYGSGKSHFLAYMAAISENAGLFKNLAAVSPEISRYQKDFFPGEILSVPVSLTSYGQDISLENAVFDSIRKKLITKGIPFPASISHKIMADFKAFVSADLVKEFFEIQDGRSVEEQVIGLREFLVKKNLSFTPIISREDFYLIIQQSLQAHFPGGILLLIDEVSEFLRSRAELDVKSEDIRFLQFLGEWNLPLNCWTVLSMQEDIEEISSASEAALNKIRDRFNNRIYLSTTHIKELLEKRLSIKQENSRQDIAAVYSEFKDYFPTWKLSFEEFYNIYPVHPATVYYLESVSNLFSKARGMVEFFYNSLHAVDPETKIPYIENNANVLITPDKVFDNFYDKIQESQATHDFIDLIYKNFVKEIPLIFKAGEGEDAEEIYDQIQAAQAIIKILILTEIAPGLKKLTIGKLAELTGKGISQLEQDANINFIRHILNQLMRSLPYIKKEHVDGRYEDIYYISPEKTVLDRFEEEVEKNFGRIVNIEKKAINLLVQRCANPRLPLQNFYEHEVVEHCPWQETPRKFLVTLAMPERITLEMLQTWEAKIERGEIEYVVALGYPVAGAENTADLWLLVSGLSERFGQSFVYWQPALVSEKNLQLLSRFYAEQYTYQLLQSESPDFLGDQESVIRQRIENLKSEALNILLEAYFPPLLLRACPERSRRSGNENLFGDIARIIIDFNQLKSRLTDRLLSQLYEEHKKIKPIISEPPLASINEVINYINENLTRNHFVVTSESMKSLIKHLVERLYLIKVVGIEIMIDPRPEQSTFIRDLLKTIEEQKPDYRRLFHKFRQSAYGCTEPQFIFVLYLLSAAGFIQIYYRNRAIKPNQATVDIIQNAEQIAPGEQVSQVFLKEYHKLTPLIGEIKSSDLHLKGQEKTWESLIEFKEKYEEYISNKILLLERFSQTKPFSNQTFASYLKSLKDLKAILSQVKRSLPSGQGIETVLNSIPSEAELQRSIIALEKIKDLDNANLQHIVFIHEYTSHPLISSVVEGTDLVDSYQMIRDKLKSFENSFEAYGLESLFSEFEQFKSAYRELYAQYHERLYPREYFAEIRGVRDSSEFRILKHLSGIELISVKNDFIRIENIINSIMASQCQRDLFTELQSRPVCSCQLKTALVEKKYSSNELMEMIKAGIAEYLAAIRSKENYNKIVEYKVTANMVKDVDASDVLEYFLNLDTATFPSLTELEKNINPHTIASLNEALSGDIIIVERDINELTEALYGRKFRPEQLKGIFGQWLDEANLPRGEVYIAISDSTHQLVRQADGAAAALELPAIVTQELERLLPGEKLDQSVEKIVAAYLQETLAPLNIEIPNFKQESLNLDRVKNIIDLLPQDKDLLQWLSPKNSAILFEVLKLDNLPLESVVRLYNSLPRFPAIRKRAMAAIYKKLNTFDEAEVTAQLNDPSEETFFLKNLLTFNEMNKSPFILPESFSQFLPFAVDQMSYHLLAQQLVRMNEQHSYLPPDFSHFFDTTVRDRLTQLENRFAEKLPSWDKERNLISWHIKKIVATEPARFIIIDGMRADFYAVLRDQLCQHAGLHLMEQNFCLSLRPSDTETFYQFLDAQQLPYLKSAERDYKLTRFKERFLAPPSEPNFFIINFLDEKLHAEKGGLIDLLTEFIERLKAFLFPILSQLKQDDVFYLSSDHGFVERTGYQYKDTPRYGHGGDGVWERVVAVGKFKKI